MYPMIKRDGLFPGRRENDIPGNRDDFAHLKKRLLSQTKFRWAASHWFDAVDARQASGSAGAELSATVAARTKFSAPRSVQ